MNKLHTAFLKGRELKNYTYAAWNEISEHRRPTQPIATLEADILRAILRELPKQEDEKARMKLAQAIRDRVVKVVTDG